MHLEEVDSEKWDREVIKSDTLMVVYFWHEKCPWCHRFTPMVEEASEEFRGKMKFVKLNTLAGLFNQEIASSFGIMSTPTLLFLCKGRPVGQAVGLMSREDLRRGLVDMLARFETCLRQSTQLKPAYVV